MNYLCRGKNEIHLGIDNLQKNHRLLDTNFLFKNML